MNEVLAVTFYILHCFSVVASSTNEVLVCYVTHHFAVMAESSSVNDVSTFSLCMPHFCLGVTTEAASVNEVCLLLYYVTHCFAVTAETSSSDE
jgi:hypothetical protein